MPMPRYAILVILSILPACVTRPIEPSRPTGARETPRVEIVGTEVDPGEGVEDEPYVDRLEALAQEGRTRSITRWASLFPDRARRIIADHLASPGVLAGLLPALSSGESASRSTFEQLENELANAPSTEDPAEALRAIRDRSEALGFRATAFEAALSLVEVLEGSPRSAAAWEAAVAVGHGVQDPELWRRALASRSGRPWPSSSGFRADHEVYAWLGHLELERDELTQALLDFRRAEAIATEPTRKAELRAEEARALYRLGHPGEASVLLVSLLDSPVDAIARDSRALAGVIAGERGDLERAKELLQRAIDGAEEWPGLPRALADLGITCLRAGEEKAGLIALERARSLFEARSDWEGVARTLLNVARYHRYRGRPDRADIPRLEADAIIRREGLLVES